MRCPNCNAEEDYQAHMRRPIRLGGKNAVQYYSCNACGTLFIPTRDNQPPERNRG